MVIVVAVHLLAVNLAAAGPILAPLVEWRGKRCGSIADETVARNLAKWSISSAVVGFGLGFLALAALTLWHPAGDTAYLSALRQVTPGRWWFAAGEIVFYFACLSVYVSLWDRLKRFRLAHRAIALAAGTNLLYHFPALFTMLSILVQRPSLRGQELDRRLYLKLLFDPETLARVLHVWLASFAVAGLTLAWVARRIGPRSSADDAVGVAKLGGRISLAATLAQVPVGVWVLLTLPETQQQRAMGGDWICTSLFGASVVAALALMHQLAMVSLGEVSKKRIRLAAVLMAGVVLLMTATLHFARS